MKRVVFAAVLMVLLLVFNSFCLLMIAGIEAEASKKLDELYYSVENESRETVTEKCRDFSDYWLSETKKLYLLVRHDLLDRITSSVSGFVPLSLFGEKGELAAEINRCKILLGEIRDSERPLLKNIF